MNELKQTQYQITCECGGYHWVRQRKPNKDKYMCVNCKLTFAAIDKERNNYIIRDKMVFKKKRW